MGEEYVDRPLWWLVNNKATDPVGIQEELDRRPQQRVEAAEAGAPWDTSVSPPEPE